MLLVHNDYAFLVLPEDLGLFLFANLSQKVLQPMQ